MLTLDAFRARYPWPGDTGVSGVVIERLWHFDLDVSPAALWPHLVDTSRLNQAMGMPEMRFEEQDGCLHGSAVYGGRRHEWVEEPWDWVKERYFSSVRTYRRGYPLLSRCIFELEPHEQGVRLWVYFGWVARGRLSGALLGIGVRQLGRDLARTLPKIAAQAAENHALRRRLRAPPSSLDAVAEQRLDEARTHLLDHSLAPVVVDRLFDLIRSGDDDDLVRIRVRALAASWGVDEHELLQVCLYATRAGALEMSWDILCPHCRGVRQEARTLGEIPRLGVCEVCDIDFTTDKLNAVEITFRVPPALRDVPQRYFCSAEASTKTHIQVQRRLEPGARVSIPLRLAAGRYRLRLHGERRYRFLDVLPPPLPGEHGGDTERADALTWRSAGTGDLTCRTRPTLTLVNDDGQPHIFILEGASWSDLALRPERLFAMQTFRDLFSEAFLAADVQLAVGEQTILFTDMVGSTRFYARYGDPDAFMAVKKHFDVIYELIGAHRGAVVKTIGDAAMGVFERPLDAVRAAHHIQTYFTPGQDDPPIRIRVSLHLGPCIAVKLNSNIDYFGTTVNLAAKLQACADAGDVAMSRTVIDTPGVLDYLEDQRAKLDEIGYPIDGIGQEVQVLIWHTFAGRRTLGSRGIDELELRA